MNPTYYVRETVTMRDGSEAHYFVLGPFATADMAHAARKQARDQNPRKRFQCVKVTALAHESDDNERVIYPAWGRSRCKAR